MPNGQRVIRMLDAAGNMSEYTWRLWEGQVPADGNRWSKPTKIVLTVHHIGLPHADGTPGSRHDKLDCRPENLIALCQKCHFAEDRDIHVAVQARRRAAKRNTQLESLGQERMFS